MTAILEKEVVLAPQDTARTVRIPFRLDKPVKMLEIRFCYSPKKLGDREESRRLILAGFQRYGMPAEEGGWERFLPLTNLVTVRLDGPDGFVGCAHRPAPEQVHLISAEKASPGFLPCPLQAGHWQLSLQVHAVNTPECFCRVRVEAEGGEGA